MLYRAQLRNSQMEESAAKRQRIAQLLLRQQSSQSLLDTSALGTTPESSRQTSLVKRASKTNFERSKDGQLGGGGSSSRGTKKKTKKVSTDTLFAVIIFYEFLRELASISEEQSVVHSLLYLPKATSLLVQ